MLLSSCCLPLPDHAALMTLATRSCAAAVISRFTCAASSNAKEQTMSFKFKIGHPATLVLPIMPVSACPRRCC